MTRGVIRLVGGPCHGQINAVPDISELPDRIGVFQIESNLINWYRLERDSLSAVYDDSEPAVNFVNEQKKLVGVG